MSAPRMHIVDEGVPAGEGRLARLIDQSAPGVWDWDVSTAAFRSSPRLRTLLGLAPGDTLDMDALIASTHPDDRDWFTRLSNAAASSDPQLIKLRIRRADTGEVRWIVMRLWRTYETDDGQKISAYSATMVDVTDEVATARALMESEERLRLAIEAGKMAVWEVDLESGQMTQSRELNILCGFDPDARIKLQDVRALYNPGEIERLAQEGHTVEAVRERAVGGAFEPRPPGALQAGSDRTQVQAEVAITTPAGVPKHLMLRAQYAPSAEGKPRLTGLLVDITEAKLAEERIAVVARELQHRVRNILSVIGAIATQSLRGKAERETELEAFRGRLDALAKANELILATHSSAADLKGLVETITRPYANGRPDRFVIDGLAQHLRPRAATALGMILHELCTNAVKYGALSVTGGVVRIDWERSDNGCLTVNWRECNGPPVAEPGRRGFGSRLIQSVLSGDLKGTVAHTFRPEGVGCRVEIGPSAL